MLRRTVLTGLALVATVTTASAANVTVTKRTCNNNTPCHVFIIEGDIEIGDDKKFENAYLSIKDSSAGGLVVLKSMGGAVIPALAIGRMIRKHEWTTFVPWHSYCVSACAMIWVAGDTSTLTAESALGFHAGYFLTAKQGKRGKVVQGVQESGAINAVIGAYYAELGYSTKAIIYMTMAPSTSMKWAKTAEMQKLGFKIQFTNERAFGNP
jgi:hypothetical protein